MLGLVVAGLLGMVAIAYGLRGIANRVIISATQQYALTTSLSAQNNSYKIMQAMTQSGGIWVPPAMTSASPSPSDGGQLPAGSGYNLTDGWGTPFGYCPWNDTGGVLAGRLTGVNVGYSTYPLFAIISAGPSRTFATTCAQVWAGSTGNGGNIVLSVSYAMASNGAPIWTEQAGGTITYGAAEQSAITSGGAASFVSVTATGTVQGATVTSTGAVTGASANITGAVDAGSIAATGAVTGASVAATGAVTGASVSATGNVSGSTLTSTVGTGTAPFSVASSTVVAGLTAQYLGAAGQDQTYFTNSSNQSSGTLPAGRLPAFTGDATSTAGSAALTLATVNGSVGTYGSASNVAQITTNAKGQVTGVTNVPIAIAGSQVSGAITGTATNVSGIVAIANGGTNANNAVSALSNLGGQPLSGELTSLSALGTTGIMARTGAATYTTETLSATANTGLSITNGNGVSGSPVFAGVAMTGATSSTAGTQGMVPAPAAGQQASFLSGAGTWTSPVVSAITNGTTNATANSNSVTFSVGGSLQAEVLGTASATNAISMTGGNGANAVISNTLAGQGVTIQAISGGAGGVTIGGGGATGNITFASEATFNNAYVENVGALGTLGCGATTITGFTTNVYTLTACASGTTTLNIPALTGLPSGTAWNVTFFVTGQAASVVSVSINGSTAAVYWDKNSTGGSGGTGQTFTVTSGHTDVISCLVLQSGNAYCGVAAQY